MTTEERILQLWNKQMENDCAKFTSRDLAFDIYNLAVQDAIKAIEELNLLKSDHYIIVNKLSNLKQI